MLQILRQFDELPIPGPAEGSERFSVVPLVQAPSYLVGRDSVGAPALLIPSSASDPSVELVAVELQNLGVSHRIKCHLVFADGEERTGNFTILRCLGDKDLYEYFLRIMDGLVLTIGINPTARRIAFAIGKLIELFRALTRLPRKPTQGLWAELFVIAGATNQSAALTSWHSTPQDTYDFNQGAQRLEVKSSGFRRRQHHFSLSQLQPPRGTRLLVASVAVELAGGGCSVGDLMDEVRQGADVSADLVRHLDLVVTETLGTAWREGLQLRYDREVAEASLAFFEGSALPVIPSQAIPHQISGVHFFADLSDLTPLSETEVRAAGGIFAAIYPAGASVKE